MQILEIRKVENPEVSVIVPTLNEEKYIERCLFSLRDQDFEKEYEIIVVDSKSKDRTVEIAKKYANKIIITEKKGAGLARNIGAQNSRGNILIFIDADTFVLKNFLREITKPFEDPEVIAATCPIIVDDYRFLLAHAVGNSLNKELMRIKMGFFPAITTAVRRDAFFEAGGYPNIWPSEDIEFSLKLRKVKGKFVFVDTTFTITSARRPRKWGILKCFRKWFLSYFIDRKIFKREVEYEHIR